MYFYHPNQFIIKENTELYNLLGHQIKIMFGSQGLDHRLRAPPQSFWIGKTCTDSIKYHSLDLNTIEIILRTSHSHNLRSKLLLCTLALPATVVSRP